MKLKATGYLHEKQKNRETKLNKKQTNKMQSYNNEKWNTKGILLPENPRNANK